MPRRDAKNLMALDTPSYTAVVPLAFHEVSAVPEGDNPEAVILMAKSKEKRMPTKTGVKNDPADPMAGFSEEQKAAVSALIADSSKKAVDAYMAGEAEKKAKADAEPAPDDEEDAVPEGKQAAKAKAVQAELAAKVAAQATELAEYKAKLAEERDARLTREYATQAGKYRAIPAKTEDVARVLREVDDKCSKEAGKALRQVLDACHESAKLGTDVAAARYGRGELEGDFVTDPNQVIESAAKALRERDPKLTQDEATRQAIRANPAAYAASKSRSMTGVRPS